MICSSHFDKAFGIPNRAIQLGFLKLGPEFVEFCCVQKGGVSRSGLQRLFSTFQPLFFRKIPIWTSIFQMGWNYHLVCVFCSQDSGGWCHDRCSWCWQVSWPNWSSFFFFFFFLLLLLLLLLVVVVVVVVVVVRKDKAKQVTWTNYLNLQYPSDWGSQRAKDDAFL